jgi:PAS domain S-box-containing protein
MNLPNTLQLRLATQAMMNTYPLCLLQYPDMRIVDANELFCNIMKLERQHIINHTFDELNIVYSPHSDSKEITEQVFNLPIQNASQFMVIPLEGDETSFHLCILMKKPAQFNIPVKKAITPSVQPKNVLARLFYHSPVPAFITLLTNRVILEVNQSFLDLIGYPRQDILGKDLLKLRLLPDPKLFEAAERKLKQGKSALPVEQYIKCNNGLWRTVLVSAEPFESSQGTCVITTLVDITERKRTKEQLTKAIGAAIQDTEAFSRAVIEKLTELDVNEPNNQLSELTERERDVLKLIAEGLDNDHIAQKLFLSEHTVRNYITHIYEKLGLHSRAEAVVWARERGLVPAQNR